MSYNNSADELKEQVFELSSSRNTFSADDDEQLLFLVEESRGKPNWRSISAKMNRKSPRQCRERYNNYLNPNLLHEEWSPEEDELLIKKHNELGNHWIAIAKCIRGRTGNSVRNRWNLLSRKHRNSHSRSIKPNKITNSRSKSKGNDLKVRFPNELDEKINDLDITDIFSKLLDVTANHKLFEMPMDQLSYYDIFY